MLKSKYFISWSACCFMLTILAILVIPGRVEAQDSKLISGVVTDATDGASLPGVTVKVKGTATTATTNVDGKYTIRAKNSDVLVFSFLGMEANETSVGSKTAINVSLKAATSSLNEVVVIGYGSVQKKDLTGAVGQVDIDDMSKAPVGSFAEALAGRVAGVQVSGSDGQPGSGFNIQVRGPNSLTQSTSPLYVIDGFPMEDLDPNSINPDDIESMSILKDASAAAIYGSRASNGVVLIQTKRGKAGKTEITFNTSIGQNLKRKEMELMSPYEYVKYQNELFPGQVGAAEYIANHPLDYYKDIEGINMQDHIFTKGSIQKYDLAIRGGNDKTRFALSGSIYDQEGIVINTGLEKYTGRLVLDQNVSEKFKVGITSSYSGVNTNGQVLAVNPSASDATSVSLSSFVMYRVWGWRPVTPPYIDTETILEGDVDPDANINGDYRINPVVDLQNIYNKRYTNTLNANAYATYDILKGLSLKVTGGVNRYSYSNDQFYNSKTSKGSPINPNNPNGINGLKRNSYANSWSNENILNYKTTIKKDHNLTGLALFSMYKENTNSNGYSGRLLPNESLGMAGLEQGISYDPVSNASENTRVSYATRWDYNYKSKYMFSGTLRADASSKFKEPWGYFPAVSAGWNMHEEDFFTKALPFVSNSKLRASWGINGNDRVGDFDWYARLTQSTNGYSFNNSTPIGAVYISAIENPNLKWEKTTTINLGYELGFFNNRIELVADFYKRTTKDLLLQALLPPTSGFGSADKNIGSLSNKGIELTLSTVNIKGKSFSWESNFNISFNQNKILELADNQQSLTNNATGFESQFNTPLYLAEIGKPAGMMFGQIWDGNYQYSDFDNPSPGVYILKSSVPTNGTAASRPNIRPGDVKYKDLNGDGIINANDKAIIGRGQPIHVGGFSNNFRYKGFSANVFFQWSVGNDIYNANRLTFEGNSNNRRNLNQYASYVNRWSPENPTNENFRAGGHGLNFYHNSKVVEDGSYLRLKTFSLSYSLPQRLIQKANLTRLSLNIAAQNLVTWTNYSGLDPEVSLRSGVLTPGYDFSAYPIARTIVFGLNAAF